MIAEDFKADGGLIRSCKHEIKEYSCKKVIDKESKNAVKLLQILLCLEENIRDGREVSGQCVAEIKQIRREMMGGLQRHQDPAPGADHPLPHAAGV